MEKEIESSTKELFFNNIAHEFRTPLSLILSPSEQLLSEIDNPLHRQKLILVKRNALYIKQLIDQLLALARLEDGKDKVTFQKVNVLDFLNELLDPFSSLAEMNNLGFEVDCSCNSKEVYGDVVKWKIVLNNLVSNGIKFTPEGGKVGVKIYLNDEILKVQVSDTGIGIDPTKIPHVFDRFYQEQRHIKHYIGTGIGLALCKEVTNSLKGDLYVESEVGEGSTFFWSVPLYDTIDQLQKIHPDAEISDYQDIFSGHKLDENVQVQANSKTYEIDENTEVPVLLIAEDNLEIRKLLKESFDDYMVIEAGNGQEAIELALRYIPKVVITDLMMPDVDGFELIDFLKGDFRTSHIPVVVTSALTEVQHRINALKKGASAYLPKPFNLKEVRLQIDNLLKLQGEIESQRKDQILEYKSDLSKPDQEFIEKLNRIIEDNLSMEHFGVENLSQEFGVMTQT